MIEIVIAVKGWKKPGLTLRLKKAVALTLKQQKATGSLTLLLSDEASLKTLNHYFRGKNKPTNVLSFPAEKAGDYLGDIALAYGVTAKEAREAKKSFADHATHLVIHGVLHLLGYDHETLRDAKVMEPLEVEILAKLGISDPYRARA